MHYYKIRMIVKNNFFFQVQKSFFVLVVLFLLAGCTKQITPAEAQPAKNTEESAKTQSQELPLVPDFTLDSMNGEKVSLSDYRGKIVVLNFWASWCPPCKIEMGDFVKLQETFVKDRTDVVLLMLNQTDGQRETRKKADDYISQNKLPFTVLYDEGQVAWGIFGSQSIPTTVVIDAQGRLSSYVMGATNYATVLKMVENVR